MHMNIAMISIIGTVFTSFLHSNRKEEHLQGIYKNPRGLLHGDFVMRYIPSTVSNYLLDLIAAWVAVRKRGKLENDYFSIVYIDYNFTFAIQGALLIR